MGTADQQSYIEQTPGVLRFIDWMLIACGGALAASLTAIVVILVFSLERA